MRVSQKDTHLNIAQLQQAHRQYHPADLDARSPTGGENPPPGPCTRDRVADVHAQIGSGAKSAGDRPADEVGIPVPDALGKGTALGVLTREARTLQPEHLRQVLGYVSLLRLRNLEASAGVSGCAFV